MRSQALSLPADCPILLAHTLRRSYMRSHMPLLAYTYLIVWPLLSFML